MSRLVYLNRPSKEVVVDLIKPASTIPLEATDLQFDSPTILVPSAVPLINRNTRLVVRSSLLGGLTGSKVVYYNRLDLGVLFSVAEVGVPEDFTDLTQALALLNQFYGLAIAIDEIDQTQTVADGYIDIIVKASLVYAPGSRIRLFSNSDLVWFENAVDLYYEYINSTLFNALMVS